MKTFVCWHDPHISNSENSFYQKTLSSVYNLCCFDNEKDASEHIAKTEDRVVVLTSGQNGKALMNSLQNGAMKFVKFIIVFCANPQYHDWIENTPQIRAVVTSINQVLTKIEEFNQADILVAGTNFGTSEITDIVRQSFEDKLRLKNKESKEKTASYYHEDDKLNISFIWLLQQCKKATFVDVQNELLHLFPKLDKNNSTKSPLEWIIWNYTGSNLYCLINQAFNKPNDYQKLKNTVSFILRELNNSQNIAKLKLPDPSKTVLYRGVKSAVVKPYKEAWNEGKTFFWPSFSSTSQSKEVAKGFAGGGGIIFKIWLNENKPHRHIVLPESWSQFPNEKEVLLLPSFAGNIEKIEDEGGFTIVTVIQSSNVPVISNSLDQTDANFMEKLIIEDIDQSITNFVEKTLLPQLVDKIDMKEELKKHFISKFDDIFDHEFKDVNLMKKFSSESLAPEMNSKLNEKFTQIVRDRAQAVLKELFKKGEELFIDYFKNLLKEKYQFPQEKIDKIMSILSPKIKKIMEKSKTEILLLAASLAIAIIPLLVVSGPVSLAISSGAVLLESATWVIAIIIANKVKCNVKAILQKEYLEKINNKEIKRIEEEIERDFKTQCMNMKGEFLKTMQEEWRNL